MLIQARNLSSHRAPIISFLFFFLTPTYRTPPFLSIPISRLRQRKLDIPTRRAAHAGALKRPRRTRQPRGFHAALPPPLGDVDRRAAVGRRQVEARRPALARRARRAAAALLDRSCYPAADGEDGDVCVVGVEVAGVGMGVSGVRGRGGGEEGRGEGKTLTLMGRCRSCR